jgi:molybdopterin-guanine dinucleotide biosynthesis protein A
MQDLAAILRAALVEWSDEPYDPFANVNTRDDLAEAEQIAAEFGL